MTTTTHLVFLAATLVFAAPPVADKSPDLLLLQEMLRDRDNPRGQSQAALLLVQNESPEAELIIRQGLLQIEDPELFQTLATAIHIAHDNRFIDELIRALSSTRPNVRQSAAETLSLMTDMRLVARLHTMIQDNNADLNARQAAIWVLGHCGRKRAVSLLMELLEHADDNLRRAAAEVLAELSGQNYGPDITRWQAWWDRHKDLSAERWMEHRLAYQSARVNRLEGELERSRAQVLRLHQQLYSRLPVGERLSYVQAVAEQDDSAVRLLAVNWVLEQLTVSDAARQQALAQVLLRLSHDGTLEVQRAAVLGLGRVNDPAGFERLRVLLQQGRAVVRAAAARSLAMQSRGTSPEALQKQKTVIPALQKSLDDPALEVVIEAAEDLGMLGALEAGPVLTALLQHPSSPVRQTAAQALERVADGSLIDGLVKGLNDSNVNVRFSLLGALTRALTQGANLAPTQQAKLMNRLETLLVRDVDPGVRSRAATVLGDVAPPAMLPQLWEVVKAAEDTRVQEKAWAAFVEILVRPSPPALAGQKETGGNKLSLLKEWDHTLAAAHQGPRRVQLLSEAVTRWSRVEATRTLAISAQEMLVQAELDLGKWAAAFPRVRELLSRPSTAAEQTQRLQWLLQVGELALHEGNREEAVRVVSEAQAYLPTSGELVEAFDKLNRAANKKE
jgi:HEAT repeat protein